MKVGDVVAKEVISVNGDDTISKALSRMDQYNIHQLPVLVAGKLAGLVLLKHLLGRDYFPSKTPIKSFTIEVPYLNPQTDLEEALVQLMKSGVRALPVVEDDELVGILSETDVIKHVEVLNELAPEEFIKDTVVISETDSIDKAIALMQDKNVSTLPVANYNGNLAGCLDNLCLIKFLMAPKESLRYSEKTAVERKSLKSFEARNYMRETFPMDIDKFSLKNVISTLRQHEEVVVTENRKPIGVIVPKDILELSKSRQNYPVIISHLNGADPFELAKFQDLLARFMEKFEKMFKIKKLFIYTDVYKKKNVGHQKFSLRARLITDKKIYIARSHGWDLAEAAHGLIDSLEKQLIKNHDRHLGKSKRRIKG